MEFVILLKYFIFLVFYPKSLVLCAKMVILLEYRVLAAIYIIIPGYYRNKVIFLSFKSLPSAVV